MWWSGAGVGARGCTWAEPNGEGLGDVLCRVEGIYPGHHKGGGPAHCHRPARAPSHHPRTTLLTLGHWYVPNLVDRRYLRVRQLQSVLRRGFLGGIRRGCTLMVFAAPRCCQDEEDGTSFVDLGTDS